MSNTRDKPQYPPPARKHGAGAAENAITAGTDMTGLAREQELRVQAELEIDGAAAMVKRRAIRLQTVSDLYYQAILGAKDPVELDRYVKRYGWLQASSLRAWSQVADLESKQRSQDITDILRGGGDE
jgi:hypothetical protein